MRNPFAATAVTLLALCLSSAAPQPASGDTALGSSAWSVEIGTDLGSGDTDGSFAIRRHSGTSSAFRLGVEVFLDKAEGDGTRTTTGSPDVDIDQFGQFHSHTYLIQWMRFASLRDNVAATFAVGPVVEFLKSTSRQGSGAGTASFSEFEFRESGTRYGLDLGLGVEWFFNPRFSLGGQTGLRAITGKRKQVQIQRSGTGPTYSKFEQNIEVDATTIEVGTARIQLAGYF